MEWFITNLESQTPFAYARFNDGEMMGIDQVHSIVARGDQVVDKSLSDALREALSYKQKNYYVGVPCSLCYPHYAKLALEIVGDYEFVTSAVDTTNRNWKKFMDTFPTLMKDRRLIWVGGADQKVDPLKNMGLNVANQVRVPHKNSWKFYEPISREVPSLFKEGDVVGISLGPTARVLVRKWFEAYPDVTFIDLGSNLDPYTRGVKHNCHLGWEETGFNLTTRCAECN